MRRRYIAALARLADVLSTAEDTREVELGSTTAAGAMSALFSLAVLFAFYAFHLAFETPAGVVAVGAALLLKSSCRKGVVSM